MLFEYFLEIRIRNIGTNVRDKNLRTAGRLGISRRFQIAVIVHEKGAPRLIIISLVPPNHSISWTGIRICISSCILKSTATRESAS
mmetsp:Transcript_17691/g.49052  ORF Transcript_17691/g.49052 Transcript_17691/m.49052 type:complete len:86 (+) Transcript_17691:313-570(+)